MYTLGQVLYTDNYFSKLVITHTIHTLGRNQDIDSPQKFENLAYDCTRFTSRSNKDVKYSAYYHYQEYIRETFGINGINAESPIPFTELHNRLTHIIRENNAYELKNRGKTINQVLLRLFWDSIEIPNSMGIMNELEETTEQIDLTSRDWKRVNRRDKKNMGIYDSEFYNWIKENKNDIWSIIYLLNQLHKRIKHELSGRFNIRFLRNHLISLETKPSFKENNYINHHQHSTSSYEIQLDNRDFDNQTVNNLIKTYFSLMESMLWRRATIQSLYKFNSKHKIFTEKPHPESFKESISLNAHIFTFTYSEEELIWTKKYGLIDDKELEKQHLVISGYNLESWGNELPGNFHIKNKRGKDNFKSYTDNKKYNGVSLGNRYFKNHKHFDSVHGREFYNKNLVTSLKLTQLKRKVSEGIMERARTTASIKDFQSKIINEQRRYLKEYPFRPHRASAIAILNFHKNRLNYLDEIDLIISDVDWRNIIIEENQKRIRSLTSYINRKQGRVDKLKEHPPPLN